MAISMVRFKCFGSWVGGSVTKVVLVGEGVSAEDVVGLSVVVVMVVSSVRSVGAGAADGLVSGPVVEVVVMVDVVVVVVMESGA